MADDSGPTPLEIFVNAPNEISGIIGVGGGTPNAKAG